MLNTNDRIITQTYNVTKQLINHDKLVNKIKEKTILKSFVQYRNSYDKEKGNEREAIINYWKNIQSINCKQCNRILLSCFPLSSRLIENIDFDYSDKLEMLSCHEGDMHKYIPNIEEKLKNVIGINCFYLQLNQHLISNCKENNIEQINEEKICCKLCKKVIGNISTLSNALIYSINILDFVFVLKPENIDTNITTTTL